MERDLQGCMYFLYMQVDIIIISSLSLSLFSSQYYLVESSRI